MLKQTWEMDAEERLALAEHRCEFLFRQVAATGGAPRRTKSPTTILIPSDDRVFSVAISPSEPRHVTVSLSYSAPHADEKRAVYAAQTATQSTIVAKVRVQPMPDKLLFSVEAGFFNDDEGELGRMLGLYLASVLDTYERFIDELGKTA